MSTLNRFQWLKSLYSTDPVPSADEGWNAANVVIVNNPPSKDGGFSFPAGEQRIVTAHDRELSWAFAAVNGILREGGVTDAAAAFSIFGRMAAAVNALLLFRPLASPSEVCMTAIEEAERVYRDMVVEYYELQAAAR